jgi:hypothetical protein
MTSDNTIYPTQSTAKATWNPLQSLLTTEGTITVPKSSTAGPVLNAYPCFNAGLFFVLVNSSTKGVFKVVNEQGQSVAAQVLISQPDGLEQLFTIDIRHQPPGTYQVVFYGPKAVWVKSIHYVKV